MSPGLLNPQGQPPGALRNAAPAPDNEAQDEQPNVTPEEQAAYESFVNAALDLMGNKKVLPGIIKSLKATDDPIANLANTAVTVVKRVQDGIQKAGHTVGVDILYQGGAEIIGAIAQLAERANVHEYTDKEIEGAWYRALDMYRELGKQDGSVNEQVLAEEFKQMMAADQQGKLGEMLPGMPNQQQGAQQPMPPPPQGG
jgi:hypothetical protein